MSKERRWMVALLAGLLVGCGGSRPETVPAGKVVQGETETGMQLKVESFLAPTADPLLAKVDAYRAAAGYPAVDYHRVTADAGAVADRVRVVRFAATADDLSAGKGVDGRFGCDVLSMEWVPAGKGTRAAFDDLRGALCAVAPTDAEGVGPGAHVVYYLVTDRGFSERNLRARRIFGPRDVEFV
jgi:hypothetical protein